MTPTQFEVIGKLLRSANSRSSQAARLVLVDGLAPSVAADQIGVSRSACSDSVKRYRDAATLIGWDWQ